MTKEAKDHNRKLAFVPRDYIRQSRFNDDDNDNDDHNDYDNDNDVRKMVYDLTLACFTSSKISWNKNAYHHHEAFKNKIIFHSSRFSYLRW